MAKSTKAAIDYEGFMIHLSQDDKTVCLTDMWRATGSIKSKETDKWLLQEQSCKLLLQLISETNPEHTSLVEQMLTEKPATNSGCKKYRAWASSVRKLAKKAGLIAIKTGVGGGTYATSKIAIAYAESLLSEKFRSWVLTVLKERIEEEVDPELGISRSRQRAIKTWQRQGKSPEYINARLESISREDYYELALSEHGVRNPKDFAWCKTMIYVPIIGTPKVFRRDRGLKDKQNLKDGMNIEEIATTDFAKVLSAKRIRTSGVNNARECASISHTAAKQVAMLLE